MKRLLIAMLLIVGACSSTPRQPYIMYKNIPHEVIDEKGNVAAVRFSKQEAESACMDLRTAQVVDFDCVNARTQGLPYP